MRKRRVPDYKHIEPVHGNLLSEDPDTLLNTHLKLQSAVARISSKVSEGSVLLDLSNCEKMDTGGLLLTMHAFTQIWRMTKLTLWFRSSGTVHAYLIENLDHFWESRYDRAEESSEEFLLRQINDREEMVEDITQYANGLRKASYSSVREVAIWETQVGELTTNGFQHGMSLSDCEDSSEPILNMVAGKAYSEKSKVEMGVLDFGVGIPRVIEQVAPDEVRIKGDGRLISYALKRGVTSHTVSENQGSGLHGIVSAVKENDGQLLILSGNGLVCVNRGRISSRNLALGRNCSTLNGTLALIVLNLQPGGSK